MDGRRKSRTQVSLIARYRSPTIFEFVEEPCFDLSEGGMFIKSKAPAPTGTLLKIECQVAEGPDSITAVARVVWLRETENAEGPRGMGVKFVKLENGSADVIGRVLARASQSLPPAAPATTPSAPPPSGSKPPPAAAAETPLPAALASTVLAMEAPPVATPAKVEKVEKVEKGKKGKKGKREATKAETPKPQAKPDAAPAANAPAHAPKPAVAPVTPAASNEGGFPTAAWVIAGIVIVVLVVVATSQKGETPEPQQEAPSPAAAIDTPAPTAAPIPAPTEAPAPEAPAPIDGVAAAIDPAAASPVAATPPEPAPTPAPEALAAPVAPTPVAAAPVEPAPVEPAPAAPAPSVPTSSASGYVVSVMSTPRGATITANDQTCTAPCTLRFSDLSTPVKVNASKARHHPTAATVQAQDPFTERDGALHRTLYLKLHPEAAAAEPETAASPASPAPAEAPTETQ